MSVFCRLTKLENDFSCGVLYNVIDFYCFTYYTVDGSDPRTSETRIAYTDAVIPVSINNAIQENYDEEGNPTGWKYFILNACSVADDMWESDVPTYMYRFVDSYMLGDANCDDDITILDATAIQRYLVHLPVVSFSEKAADCDGDGEVSIVDVTFIQRLLVSIDVPYNIGDIIFKIAAPTQDD